MLQKNICQETLQIQADQIRLDTLLCECSRTLYNHLVFLKMERNYFENVPQNSIKSKSFTFKKIKNLPERDIKTTTIFCLSKPHQNMCAKVTSVFHLNYTKKYTEATLIFCLSKSDRKSTLKRRWYFAHRSYFKQITWKQRKVFVHQNYIEESTSKQLRFLAHWN